MPSQGQHCSCNVPLTICLESLAIGQGFGPDMVWDD